MASPDQLAVLKQDYESGKSPLAFVPYATALRRERSYQQAIDVCQRGLAKAPGSVAGRTLLGRLYCDVGKYSESRELLESILKNAPDAVGPLTAYVQTLLRVNDLATCEQCLETLNRINPLDPDVQLLNSAYRKAVGAMRVANAGLTTSVGQAATAVGAASAAAQRTAIPVTHEELIDEIVKRVAQVAPVTGGALVSLTSKYQPARSGKTEAVLEAVDSIREIQKAYEELEFGTLLRGDLILQNGTLLFSIRAHDIVVLLLQNTDKTPRARTAFEAAVSRLLPSGDAADTAASEVSS